MSSLFFQCYLNTTENRQVSHLFGLGLRRGKLEVQFTIGYLDAIERLYQGAVLGTGFLEYIKVLKDFPALNRYVEDAFAR